MTHALMNSSIYTPGMDIILYFFTPPIQAFLVVTGLEKIMPELLLVTVACFDIAILVLIFGTIRDFIKNPRSAQMILLVQLQIWFMLISGLFLTSVAINAYIEYAQMEFGMNNATTTFLHNLNQVGDWVTNMVAILSLPFYATYRLAGGFVVTCIVLGLGLLVGFCEPVEST